MKFRKSHIPLNQVVELEENIEYKNVREPLIGLKDVKVKASISTSEEKIINVYFVIKGTAILSCARTLKPVPYKFDFKDSIDISEDLKNLDTYFVQGDLVDLDPIIYDLITGELPSRVFSKDAKNLHVVGDGYRIMTEDDLRKEREEERIANNPFSKIDENK